MRRRRFHRNLRGAARNHFPRLRVPLQAFQVSTQFARGLIAKIAVLLQRLADDFFKPRWDFGIQADGSGGYTVEDGVEDRTRRFTAKRQGAGPISYSTAPKENRSVRASSSLPLICSGDIYATVPSAAPGLVRCSSLIAVG